ncbi:MAG: aquaporin [Bacteroidota bacterium]
MKKYLTELVGTFFLVLVIGLAGAEPISGPLAIGTILMVMVFMGGHISGAHYNPAVSLSLLFLKKIELKDTLMYIGFQVLGATLAALVSWYLTDQTFAPAPGVEFSTMEILVAEILFTFALVIVILNVAATESPSVKGNSYYGLAIGFTVMAGAFAVGGISGGAFNPAVGLGPILVELAAGDTGSVGALWIYLAGPITGGLLAALFFRFQES